MSVVSEGADPTGVNDSTTAFNDAITAAGAGGTVWIPPGTYDIPGHIIVNNVTVEGAGMWYSTITGAAPGFYGNGAPKLPAGAPTCTCQNFAIFGNVQIRDDSAQVNGIGGAMSNSTVSNIWIEHMKVGAWMDGPMTNLTFSGMRIRDTTADGINLHGGVTNSTITDSDIRNTGDDGIALWADASIGADSGNIISNNTVQQQQLANGIAVYGGNNNTVTGNLVEDTGINQGGGITAAQRFDSTPLGLTTISNNTMIRDGQLDPNWQFGVGALWFDGEQGWGRRPGQRDQRADRAEPVRGDPVGRGHDHRGQPQQRVHHRHRHLRPAGTDRRRRRRSPTSRRPAWRRPTRATPRATAARAPASRITDDGGNSGISPAQCSVGDAPTPVYPPYPVTGVNASPTRADLRPAGDRHDQRRAERDGRQPDQRGRRRSRPSPPAALSPRPTTAARRSRRTAPVPST